MLDGGVVFIERLLFEKMQAYALNHGIKTTEEVLPHILERLEKIDNIENEQNKRKLTTKEL